MAGQLRPVKEIWGMVSDRFISPNGVISLFNAIASDLKMYHDSSDYNDNISFYFGDGDKFLEFVTSPAFTPEWAGKKLGLDQLQDKDEWRNVEALVSNIRNSAIIWKGSINTDGTLIFYIDNE